MPNWNDVLREIQQVQVAGKRADREAQDTVRRKYLDELHKHTDRNVIAYYSGFLSKPGLAQLEINDEDKNGFMMTVHKLDRKRGLDLIIHSPGGNIGATQSIVDYLRRMFSDNIRAIIPQIAMSAGTMIACSCKEIVMGKHSNLGPIDPHLNNIPAYGVIREFKKACDECSKNRALIPMWQAIVGQYRPTFLDRCENAIKWSNSFVREQLRDVMFKGDPQGTRKAAKIVKRLTDYTGNKTHERHIHQDECIRLGLKIGELEKDATLQDLVLTVHHCYMNVLMNTPCFKAIENHLGIGIFKRQITVSA
jgi:ATP-dependent protease ClpP protease subunit